MCMNMEIDTWIHIFDSTHFPCRQRCSLGADRCGSFQADHFGDREGRWKRTPCGEKVFCDVKVHLEHHKTYFAGDRRHRLHQLASCDLINTRDTANLLRPLTK